MPCCHGRESDLVQYFVRVSLHFALENVIIAFNGKLEKIMHHLCLACMGNMMIWNKDLTCKVRHRQVTQGRVRLFTKKILKLGVRIRIVTQYHYTEVQ